MSRVLIVDDEPDLRDLFSEVMTLAGHQVIGTAKDGDEAVFKFEEAHPDIVLMDHRMPKMSGADATEEIVHRHPDAKVLIVTADDTITNQAQEFGAVGVVHKPFNLELLLHGIDDAVMGKGGVVRVDD